MSPRKAILRELNAAGLDSYRRPSDLDGFAKQPPKYRDAVNGLLKDQLISGNQDSEGNLVIGLNRQRIAEVQREIRPWFRAPVVWGGAVAAITLALVALLI